MPSDLFIIWLFIVSIKILKIGSVAGYLFTLSSFRLWFIGALLLHWWNSYIKADVTLFLFSSFWTAVGISKVTRSNIISDIVTVSNPPCANTTAPEDCIWKGDCGCISRICTSMRAREMAYNSSEHLGACVCISFPYSQSKKLENLLWFEWSPKLLAWMVQNWQEFKHSYTLFLIISFIRH